VIIMMMGEEDGSNIPNIKSSLRNPTRCSVASVNDIENSIDDQQVRGLSAAALAARCRNCLRRNFIASPVNKAQR
jgi:hypothetical protein